MDYENRVKKDGKTSNWIICSKNNMLKYKALLIWYSFLEVILLKAKRLYLQNLYLFNNAKYNSC